MGLIQHVGAVCAELRGKAGIKPEKIAVQLREGEGEGVTKVHRFEAGKSQPRDVNEIVMIYAAMTQTPYGAIWRRALERYEASGEAQRDFDRALDNLPRPPRPKRRNND